MSILTIPRSQGGTSGTVLATSGIVVFSIIRLFPTAKQHGQVVEIMRSVQDLTRPLPGCLGCWLSEQDYLHNHIRYAEQWESEEALHEHIRSELYRRVLAAMELSRQSPEVKFYYASEEKGFELIETIRYQEALQPRIHR
jgi:quinol monooxygenase YgiN